MKTNLPFDACFMVRTNRAFFDSSTTPPQVEVLGRPFVVLGTAFARRSITEGRLKLLKDLPETARDADWAGFLADHDGDYETALKNYLVSIESGPEGEPEKVEPEPEPELTPAQKAAATKAKKKAEAEAAKEAEAEANAAKE